MKWFRILLLVMLVVFLSFSSANSTSIVKQTSDTEMPVQKEYNAHDMFLDKDALELSSMLKAGFLSQHEIVEIIIGRIEASDPLLNFITTPAFVRARNKAGSIPLDSTFAGVPILMKDMIDVGGIRRTDGSRLNTTNIPQKNVPYVDAVEKAGFNILGMTNVPEFASCVVTDNDMFGATRNPWNLDYSTFSSSGGAAAVVAAGVLPVAHCTDGGGSCRLPASCTGILGMKPSRYRMLSGEADGGHDIAKTNQIMSRTVRDNAALFNQTEDKSGKFYEPVGFVEGKSHRRLRIAYAYDAPGLMGVEPEVMVAFQNSLSLLRDMGHVLAEAQYPVDIEKFFRGYNAFFAEKVGGLREGVERISGRGPLDSGLLTRFLASTIEYESSLDAESVVQDRAYLDTLPERFDSLFEKYDILITPVSPVVGVKLNDAGPNDTYNMERARFTIGCMKFTAPVNFAGNPAMSVPLYWKSNSGLPIGTHFIAARGNDRLLYELAYELEEARPWKDKWAPHSLKYVGNEQAD